MTDLSRVLPDFPIAHYAHLLPAIEKHQLTVTDLLTLEPPDLGKRTQLPLLDLKRLCDAVLEALHADLGVADGPQDPRPGTSRAAAAAAAKKSALRHTGTELVAKPWRTISTLDAALDAALGGGVPAGYVTEITGESGAGKTQFLLTLLLAVQLPPPRGLGRPALYISTEAPLSTPRLAQILARNPTLRALADEVDSHAADADADDAAAGGGTKRKPRQRPSLDRIVSTVTPDLESQDHILSYQVPVEVARRNVGLLVLDSVAANYRAEFERANGSGGGGGKPGSNMAARSAELVRLGAQLVDLARRHGLAVVVANQVADRVPSSSSSQPPPPPPPVFGSSSAAAPKSSSSSSGPAPPPPQTQESPLARRSRGAAPPAPDVEPTSSMADVAAVRSSMSEPQQQQYPPAPPQLLLDHQQRWFTGWGDEHPFLLSDLKTPSLGLVWSTQIAARLALLRRPAAATPFEYDEDGERVATSAAAAPPRSEWRRWMKVVFAPHVPASGPGLRGAVEFEVTMGGLRGVETGKKKKRRRKSKGQDDTEEE
ncbi:DNA repair protein RAD57 [Xylariomycetidae sp. FL0641]|nr:DNA repair protein RAD57 [Xylariomycetidae sp. FL0641]